MINDIASRPNHHLVVVGGHNPIVCATTAGAYRNQGDGRANGGIKRKDGGSGGIGGGGQRYG